MGLTSEEHTVQLRSIPTMSNTLKRSRDETATEYNSDTNDTTSKLDLLHILPLLTLLHTLHLPLIPHLLHLLLRQQFLLYYRVII